MLHCLPFHLHLLDTLLYGITFLFKFRITTSNFSGVRKFRNFTVSCIMCEGQKENSKSAYHVQHKVIKVTHVVVYLMFFLLFFLYQASPLRVKEDPQSTTVVNVRIVRQLGTFGEVNVNFTVIWLMFYSSLLQVHPNILAPANNKSRVSSLVQHTVRFFKQWVTEIFIIFSSPEPKAHMWAYSVDRHPSSAVHRPATFSNDISSEAMKPIHAKFHI